MVAVKENPLRADAYADETKPCVIPFGEDDRSGAHVTDDWLTALSYAAYKCEGLNVPVIIGYDATGLDLIPDFDAECLRQNFDTNGDVDYVAAEWNMPHVDEDNHEEFAGHLESIGENGYESVEPAVLGQAQEKHTRMVLILAEKLQAGDEETFEIFNNVLRKVGYDWPLEWYAEAVQQWRSMTDIPDAAIAFVELVRPFSLSFADDYVEDNEDRPAKFTTDDMGPFSVDEDAFDTVTVFGDRRNADVFHGTDLQRAQSILANLNLELTSPWPYGMEE